MEDGGLVDDCVDDLVVVFALCGEGVSELDSYAMRWKAKYLCSDTD